ncbi:hypothetical protein [Tunicatimonas pelagia]|uniref:hypothetical protein n=1 Tax=Tunicatimonas pelagia TaxID=931531 RepID=UPI002665D8A3|nr:hypothetical protein [Tunicatimonas pelagia]WKN41159.1 hypothetical protein P0M28_19170 [Tunicatimonas pelagia]
MALYTELTEIITELDSKQNYPYSAPEGLSHRFCRFREAMQLVATTLSNQRGRAFLRKYETGSRGQQLDQLEDAKSWERDDLVLMLGFCQDANQLENYLKRTWKSLERQIKSQ